MDWQGFVRYHGEKLNLDSGYALDVPIWDGDGKTEIVHALAQAQPEVRPGAMEALFRAYAVDVMRLHKPAKLGEILPFKMPEETSFILEIAKAYKAKSPRDPVDVEIAARWYAAGYDQMKPDEYTAAINAKTGANLKPDAMKKRRLKKLRLLSSNRPANHEARASEGAGTTQRPIQRPARLDSPAQIRLGILQRAFTRQTLRVGRQGANCNPFHPRTGRDQRDKIVSTFQRLGFYRQV
jgi:hypothetical protein